MQIDRHKITTREREAIEHIIANVHVLRPDNSVAAPAGAQTLLMSIARPQGVRGYSLRLGSAELVDLQELQQLVNRMKGGDSQVLVIEDMPIDNNASALLMLFGTMIGEIREFEGHGFPIIEVSDKGKIVGGRPSSDNRLAFGLHTDMSFYPEPPAFVLFLMLQTGASGGESLFSSAEEVAVALPAGIRATLEGPFTFVAPPHRPHDAPLTLPILDWDAGTRPRVRYRRDGLAPANDAQRDALEAFYREADARVVELPLLPGELAIYSNTRVLHGRRAFVDGAGAAQSRSALRAYADASKNVT